MDTQKAVENELTSIITKYHADLGVRMVLDKGRNEMVSPSRELAKKILNSGYIPKQFAPHYVEICGNCGGIRDIDYWGMEQPCPECNSKGIVMRKEK